MPEFVFNLFAPPKKSFLNSSAQITFGWKHPGRTLGASSKCDNRCFIGHLRERLHELTKKASKWFVCQPRFRGPETAQF